jgi:hypothetical protein
MSHLKPSFFIIGERKCGTSSLFRYLLTHPHILPGKWKEPQFFSKYPVTELSRHIDGYWSNFPEIDGTAPATLTWPELDAEGTLFEEKIQFDRKQAREYITGDASANTFCEVDPEIIFQFLPQVKLILLFRDPVLRAFSHHRMFLRFQEEGRDLGRHIDAFELEMEREIEAYHQGEQTLFISPGIYIQQLRKWEAIFPNDQFRIYFTEHLADLVSAIYILEDIQSFLELPLYPLGAALSQRYNQAPMATIPAPVEQKLRAFYAPFNQELAEHLSADLPGSWK